MTPDRPFHRDTREDMEGLVHRAQIIRPAVILADGTASSDQVATVPPGVDVGKAIFANNCATCHGSAAQGAIGGYLIIIIVHGRIMDALEQRSQAAADVAQGRSSPESSLD